LATWSGSALCTVTLIEELQPGWSLHCTGKQCCLFRVCYKEPYPCIFHVKWGRMHYASSEDVFCTKTHWLSCFYYTNQMHMAGWIQPCELKDTPAVSCYIDIKLYIMFQNTNIFVW